jgi:signal peptidase I
MDNILKKVWNFIWNDNSLWSWIVNAALAFLIIKFLVYPGLGFVLATNHPVVAVISDSMEHTEDFETWWDSMELIYEKQDISKEEFRQFRMSNGFNKGDIIILKGKKPEEIFVGDIIVFQGGQPEPIIHRVINRWEAEGIDYFSTKGDKNSRQRTEEVSIHENRVIGTAWLKVPFAGYVKIIFSDIINSVRN